MCLAIPARVTSIDEYRMSTVDIMGVTRKVSLDLVPEAVEGDWVLVHAGFALQVIDEEVANDTLDLLKQIPFFQDEEEAALGVLEEA
jgi:hydrogenase expression/formation protein HypC